MDPTVSLALSCRLAPAVLAKVIAPVSGTAAPPESATVPALIVINPVRVLVPERVRVPAPPLVNPSVPPPVPFCKTPAKVVSIAWLTVRVAAVALAFSTTAVPGIVAVASDAMVTLLPPICSLVVAGALVPNVTLLGVVLLSAPTLPSVTVPALMVNPPVKVLLPESVKEPVPVLASPSVPDPFWITPPNVEVVALPPTVRVAAPAIPLVMVPVPVIPLRFKLLPLMSSDPGLVMVRLPLPTPDGMAVELASFSMPAEIVVLPE